MAKIEGARADSNFIVISQTPDVCKTPPSGTPVPYPIVALLSDHTRESPSVNFRAIPVMTKYSRVTKVIGDEAGAMGGVKSGVNIGFCRPIEWSPTVRVNGHNILYHQNTLFDMNCAGPDGPGNTIGILKFVGLSVPAVIGPEGLPPGNPKISCENSMEKSFMQNMTSTDLISGLAKMAPQLANMDWKNPMSALGALGGLAGIAGFGQLAQAANLVGKGIAILKDPKAALSLLGPLASMAGIPGAQLLNLANVNRSNPGSFVGGAAGLAGIVAHSRGIGSRNDPRIMF